jgi:acetyl coenzyme A synthetase (ADP forming)-like protein
MDIVLRDGSTLALRVMRPDERPDLARVVRDTLGSDKPLERRLASWLGGPPPTEAGAELILVGELAGRVQALAGYHRDHGTASHAGVAIAVTPAVQGRGVGTRFLEILADEARQAGVESFEAWLSREDEPMLAVFVASGFDIDQQRGAGVLHVSLKLVETPRFLEQQAARAQSAAAASMRAAFEPRAVAVIGAGRERGKIGSEILHNLISAGFTGALYPIHPSADRIDGLVAYPRVSAVPGPVDLAVIAVPADRVPGVVDDCVAKGVKTVVVITAGFAETGPAGRAQEAALLDTVRAAGIRLVGPNCMGLINTDPAVRLNATFSPVYPPPGNIAMSTQSGALGLAILDYARQLDIGISTFVSVGNKADVSGNDLIQYWSDDDRTRVILLYVESFGNPRKFAEIARRVARRKPIVVVKSGRSASGARAASSHTGALASSDRIVDALFHQAGVIRTDTLEELFDVAALLAHQPVPRGRRVAIITNAGGPGILSADACEAQGLELPRLSDATLATLKSFLPPAAAVANPVDMIASASAEDYRRALAAVLADDRVDSVLVIFIPPLVTKSEDVARAVKDAAATRPDKPVVGIFMSAQVPRDRLSPIPCFEFPESAAVALARATHYGEWLSVPPGHVPELTDIDQVSIAAIIERAMTRGGGWLPAADAQTLIEAAGIRAAKSRVAASEEDAVRAAAEIGYPLVLKVVGPDIVHKTDVGGVRVGLRDEAAVRAAWRDFAARLGDRMTGALVQQMVTAGVEMLVGATEDPTFGPVVACATGGVLAELIHDAEFRLHPLTDRDAEEMVNSLRGTVLLRGHRGAPVADEAALRQALLRLSAVIGANPQIQEIEINPLCVLTAGVMALDVRVRVGHPPPATLTRRVRY